MKLYNSLSRKIEEFEPRNKDIVGVYTCGPTVYDTATIANFRTYIMGDLVVRTLRYLGYKVKYVMNLTDVGHLTGDNEGDADTGEDRMEKGAEREGKTAWDIAEHYSQEFVTQMKMLNLVEPDYLVRATAHIPEQITLVEELEQKGLTYKISDGVYFDVAKFDSLGFEYGELSTLDEIKEGARVARNEEKRDPRDFALWKFSPKGVRRQMEWDSPWGMGFPGWHIECSAMSMKYLGVQFDIHIGGEDLRSTHHPNEIAQSEGATGKRPFVKYWMHGAFLLVDGGRMGKSLGNAYTVDDLKTKGYDPIVLRYLYLTGSYRKQLNFTWEALNGVVRALERLRQAYYDNLREKERTSLSNEKLDKIDTYREQFEGALSSDLDMPTALSVVWGVVKSNMPGRDKADLLRSFDEVLGLGLDQWKPKSQEISKDVLVLVKKRDKLRKAGKYKEADKVRDEIKRKGFRVKDGEEESIY